MLYSDVYGLRKPQMAETASVADINYNTDRIDSIMRDNRRISTYMYVSTDTYNTGDLVGYENPSTHEIRLYRCLDDGVTGTWDATKWEITSMAAEVITARESGGDNANQNIADAFDATSTYAVGDYVIYNSILYKCTTAISTAGAWDSTKWTSCVVTDEMGQGGGGSSTLAGLSDVDLATPADGQLLVYDGDNSEWVNGNISGVNIQPIIYSTEEREVGVWTDGKPLYQKTYEVSISATSNQWVDTGIDIANGISIKCEAVLYQSDGVTIMLESNIYPNGDVYILNPRNVTMSLSHLTLWYTKTTDTAGSGIWTPSGVPAVHYSTDEHVVGTWIDGSTLYQRTYHNISISNGANNVVDNSFNDNTLRHFQVDLTGITNVLGSIDDNISDTLYVDNNVLYYYLYKNGNWWNALNTVDLTIQYTKSSS